VSALDKGTNKQQTIRIESSSGLSQEEIERMRQEAEANAESDKKLKEEAELLNLADSTVFQSEKSMKDLEDKLTEEQKNELNELISNLKTSYESKNMDEIQPNIDKLNNKFQEVTQNLYSQTTENDGDNLSDVEFEEVL
jgi:molecular chaperone DnaK